MAAPTRRNGHLKNYGSDTFGRKKSDMLPAVFRSTGFSFTTREEVTYREQDAEDAQVFHYASDLRKMGLEEEIIDQFIPMAIKVCKSSGLLVYSHFKMVFVGSGHVTNIDWLISPLAARLIYLLYKYYQAQNSTSRASNN